LRGHGSFGWEMAGLGSRYVRRWLSIYKPAHWVGSSPTSETESSARWACVVANVGQ